jgi:branched-chain amino acid transport system ATP-binding protein
MALELRSLEAGYGGALAVQGVSLTVAPGRIVTLLGPNGAGKSTTLRAVAGLVRPRAGEILLDGERLHGLPADAVVRRGLALRTSPSAPIRAATGPQSPRTWKCALPCSPA